MPQTMQAAFHKLSGWSWLYPEDDGTGSNAANEVQDSPKEPAVGKSSSTCKSCLVGQWLLAIQHHMPGQSRALELCPGRL